MTRGDSVSSVPLCLNSSSLLHRRRPGQEARRSSWFSWLRLDDLPVCQVDALADWLLRLWNLVFPELLHRPRHDDERTIPNGEAHGFLGLVVLDAEGSRGTQRQGANHLAHFGFVVRVHTHAVLTGTVAVQQTEIVPTLNGLDLLLDVQ